MPVTVRLPAVLAEKADGQSTLDVEVPTPATLGALVDVLAGRHPGLGRRLRDESGTLRRYVNFFVDGEESRYLAGADTPVADGTEVQVIPSVAGG